MRMSEMTAVAFLLSGIGLGLGSIEQARLWTQGLALAVAAISMTAAVGYWYGVDALYAFDPFESMALHTSLGFGVLAVGLLLAWPDRGLVALIRSPSVAGITARRYLPLCIVGPLIAGRLQLLGVERGLYRWEFGTVVVASASSLLLSGLVAGYANWLERAQTRRDSLEAQLLRAQKMESMGRLAGGIAHDFNNVLTVVLNTVSLMKQDATDERVLADLETIRDASLRASALTKQLLALGRRQVLRPRVLNMNEMLRGTETLVRRLVPESIRCTFRLADDLGNVLVDPGKLEQVVLNLVSNAADAMPEGGELTLETRNAQLDETYTADHADVEAGPHVVLVVSDDGLGMDRATVESIFEPFFTTKAPGRGTGLGLSTTYGIVRQSGGHIWVYSEKGHGTTFKIYLPRVLDDTTPLAPGPERPLGSLAGTGFILFVDDDDRLREVAAKVLRRAGYDIEVAANGAEALQFSASRPEPIDLVVTDVMIPEMGGRELALRLQEMRPQVRFLYISGYADDRVIREGLDGRPVGLLEKPFTPDELLREVQQVLQS
jgi:signal transduction histidine kinase/CheY-like chemotaxis protein